ncbi:MAG: hypothetical protein M3299_00380 [Thermoproteota archaeon]|nr:hypothetical protein [Thermoproteota archaeon]
MAGLVAYLRARCSKVSDKIVELAEIKSGDKVLDIATGIGKSAVTVICIVGKN